MHTTIYTENFRIILRSILKFTGGCIDTAAGIGIFFTVAGLFGRFHWFLELFTQLKLPLALCFSGYAIYKLICRRFKAAALTLIPLLINTLPPMLLLMPQQHQTLPSNPVAVRILQANILTSNRNSAALLKLIENCDPDVIILQETNRRWIKELDALRAKYPINAAFPREDNFGAAIFCKHTNAIAQILFLNDPYQLPLTRVVLTLNNKTVTLTGAHPLAPINQALWKERNRYTAELAQRLARIEGAQIITGDLNNTPWTVHYKKFVKTSGLLDSSQGRGGLPTWPTFQPVIRIPLDHCLHSRDVIIKSRKRGPQIGSDHFPLIIDAVF